MSRFQILFRWYSFFLGVTEAEQRGEVQRTSKSPASNCVREKKVCKILLLYSTKNCFAECFLLDRRMDVTEEEPEEEWEEDLEEELGRSRRGKRSGTRGTWIRNKKRTIKQKVCLQLHYWRYVSHLLLMIHLLLIDGWRTENGEDDNSEWNPEQDPSCGEKMSMK